MGVLLGKNYEVKKIIKILKEIGLFENIIQYRRTIEIGENGTCFYIIKYVTALI